MADMFDYLDTRGDLSLSVLPFNEVDNLILAHLSYVDYSGIVPNSGDAVPLTEVRERFFQRNSREEFIRSEAYRRILPRIRSFLPETPVVGLLLSSAAKHHVVKSRASGILQHEAFSWEILRDHFVETEISETGKLIDRTLDKWLDGMDDETRRFLVDTLFAPFESTGKANFRDILSLKGAETVLGSFFSIPKEKQKELKRLAGLLIQSGGQVNRDKRREAASEEEEREKQD